jgi:hypothetical protein
MQRYTVYLYLETALHISGGTSTHHQELVQISVAASGCRVNAEVVVFPAVVGFVIQ